MNCKNCKDPLEENAQFCDNCGAKVITKRITLKLLISQLFSDVFGVDSKFFLTLKKMISAPDEVLNEYLTGVRKRYVNPFAFLAVGAALSLLVFNFFDDDFLKMQSSLNPEQTVALQEMANKDLSAVKNISEKELVKLKKQQQSAKIQLLFLDKWSKFSLNYFNLLAFLFLPFYAMLSKFTYYKPHNYGEHIVINAYLQGTTMYFSVIAFFISLVTNPLVYNLSIICYLLFYLFAFSKLYKHSVGKSILKLFRFLIVLAVAFLAIMIIGIAIFLVFRLLK